MAGLVIWVDFRLKPGAFDAFHDLVTANAAASVGNEPGCRQFDVLVPDDGLAADGLAADHGAPDSGAGGQIALYEIYDDAAAFAAHLATPHFKDFDVASADLVTHKSVRRYVLSDHNMA